MPLKPFKNSPIWPNCYLIMYIVFCPLPLVGLGVESYLYHCPCADWAGATNWTTEVSRSARIQIQAGYWFLQKRMQFLNGPFLASFCLFLLFFKQHFPENFNRIQTRIIKVKWPMIQCAQMAGVFIQYFAIYSNERLHNSIKYFQRKIIFCQTLINLS